MKTIKIKFNIINEYFLKDISKKILKNALDFYSLIFSIKLTSYFLLSIFNIYFVNVKLIVIFVLLY